MPSRSVFASTRSTPPSTLYGFVRERADDRPAARQDARDVARRRAARHSPSRSPRQPSRTPTTPRRPRSKERRATARMTAFRPGQSPPPVRTPTVLSSPFAPNFACRASSDFTRPERRPSDGRCRRRGSNPHGAKPHWILSPARLPVPPLRRGDTNASLRWVCFTPDDGAIMRRSREGKPPRAGAADRPEARGDVRSGATGRATTEEEW